mmetsp:Transcript_88825/g.250210  ORF Transcript_88825/g.250210 Transcript_88825/m.250210 type:complete len:231 (+) Transcript_88825:371-1063(+)
MPRSLPSRRPFRCGASRAPPPASARFPCKPGPCAAGSRRVALVSSAARRPRNVSKPARLCAPATRFSRRRPPLPPAATRCDSGPRPPRGRWRRPATGEPQRGGHGPPRPARRACCRGRPGRRSGSCEVSGDLPRPPRPRTSIRHGAWLTPPFRTSRLRAPARRVRGWRHSQSSGGCGLPDLRGRLQAACGGFQFPLRAVRGRAVRRLVHLRGARSVTLVSAPGRPAPPAL